MKFLMMIKKPSAFLPLAMSFAALAVVLAHIAIYGTARKADEGTAAHLWQLLMAAQLPLLLFFAVRWLLVNPKESASYGTSSWCFLAAAAKDCS